MCWYVTRVVLLVLISMTVCPAGGLRAMYVLALSVLLLANPLIL